MYLSLITLEMILFISILVFYYFFFNTNSDDKNNDIKNSASIIDDVDKYISYFNRSWLFATTYFICYLITISLHLLITFSDPGIIPMQFNHPSLLRKNNLLVSTIYYI